MLEIRVLNGLHRGVSLLLEGEQIVIGTSLVADLVLVDPGICEQHVSIKNIQDSSNVESDTWEVVKLEGEVWDISGALIHKRKPIRVGEKLNIGGVWLCISIINDAWPMFDQCLYTTIESSTEENLDITTSDKLRSKIKKITRYLTLLILTGSIIIYANGYSTNEYAESTEAKVNSEDNIQTYLAIFKHMLKERELNSVSIDVENKQWTLVGELEHDQLARLERMIIRFNLQHPSDVIINNHVKQISRSLPFNVIRVTTGPYAHIITDDSIRITPGESLKGFRLISIKGNKILFGGKYKVEIVW